MINVWKFLGFWHPRFWWCHQMDNWTNNFQEDNLKKIPQIHYPTHHLVVILANLWVTHLQPCLNEGLQMFLIRRMFHWHNPKNIKGLKTMTLNELPYDDSRKLSWEFSWITQWHTSMVLLWTNKELAWINFGETKWFPTIHQISEFRGVFGVVWMQNFKCSHKLATMMWCHFSTKGPRCIGPQRWHACGRKFHDGPNFWIFFFWRRWD
jgi:hypothetical protein